MTIEHSVHWGCWGDGKLPPIYDWCDTEIGRFNYTVAYVENFGRRIIFDREEDKVKFILKWL